MTPRAGHWRVEVRARKDGALLFEQGGLTRVQRDKLVHEALAGKVRVAEMPWQTLIIVSWESDESPGGVDHTPTEDPARQEHARKWLEAAYPERKGRLGDDG